MKLNSTLYRNPEELELTASPTMDIKEEKASPPSKKGFFQRIKAALQEWSNQDYAQQVEDDNKV